MSKEEIRELKRREKNVDLAELMASELSKIHSLKNLIVYLMVKGDFPSEERKLRCKTITLDDWENFIRYPHNTRFLESNGDMPPNSPPALAGSSGISLHQLTSIESFKLSVKRDSSQLKNFKEVNHWYTW